MKLGLLKHCPVKLSCRRQNPLHSLKQAGYMSPSWMNNLILKVYFKAAHQVVSLPTAASQPEDSHVKSRSGEMIFSKCSTKLCPDDNIVSEYNYTCQQTYLSCLFRASWRRQQWNTDYPDKRGKWVGGHPPEDQTTAIWKKTQKKHPKISHTLFHGSLNFFWCQYFLLKSNMKKRCTDLVLILVNANY